MSKVFIIYGLGNHFKQKIYPALSKFKKVIISDIKTTKSSKVQKKYLDKYSKNFIANSAYIATPISTHYDYLKKLSYNENIKYVFCEKTLTENKIKTNKIINLYKSKKKYLIETYMYIYHPEFLYLKKFINENKIKHSKGAVFCRYTIPKLDKKNHRNNKLLTGGELYEIGCYPISLIYFLFNYDDKIIKKNTIKKIVSFKDGVLIKLKIHKLTFIISWGYNLSYRNKFIFYSKKYSIITEKIFGKKNEDSLKLKIYNYLSKKLIIKQYYNNDNFYYMFKYFFKIFLNKKDMSNIFYKDSLKVSSLINFFNKLI